MKTTCFKMDWLIPVLGIAVVAGCLVAATTYRELERQGQADQALMPMLDRLCHDHTLSLALKALHDGEVGQAAQRLDLLLCWDVLRTDTELASADARSRAWAEDLFRRIARARPKNWEGAPASSIPESAAAQAAAQQVLDLALKGDPGTLTMQRGRVFQPQTRPVVVGTRLKAHDAEAEP